LPVGVKVRIKGVVRVKERGQQESDLVLTLAHRRSCASCTAGGNGFSVSLTASTNSANIPFGVGTPLEID
jgi:hypothetical protein